MERIPLLSFFSGGGFLDLGFELAGFDVVWSNEIRGTFAEMYCAGLTSWRQFVKSPKAGDSPLVNQTSIGELTCRTILSEAFGSTVSGFFGVIGGPPCQDFSQSGKDLGSKGERGRLTQSFVDLVCSLRPSFFLMENVSGLYRKKHRGFYSSIVKQLQDGELGYLTTTRILNALEYGVPQTRERLFLLGFRKDIIAQGGDSHALADRDWFPWPQSQYENARKLEWPETSPFGCEDVPVPASIPLELTVGRLIQDEVEQVPNGKECFNPYSSKFKTIAEGDVSGKSFKRLHRYRYSPTVWYGNNEVHLHPWKPRRLTVREALRIQTVPDQYVLPAENTLTDKFTIISNGVPTLLAHCIASAMLGYIRCKELAPFAVEAPETATDGTPRASISR